jgi:endonuclease/exonuclease/phosphatase (EEP) superfamily protein YafD
MFDKKDFVRLLVTLIVLSGPGKAAQAFWFNLPKIDKMVLNYGGAENESLDPDKINILVWNIYKADRPSWTADFQEMREGQDIVVLQECTDEETILDSFFDHSGFSYQYAISFQFKKDKVKTGTCTGSSVTPKHAWAVRSNYVEIAGFTPKALLLTEYPLEGLKEKLLVINIHALNSVPAFMLKNQLEQATPFISNHQGPVLFGGDFNTWSFFKLWTVRKFMKKHALKEVDFPNGGERMRASVTKMIIDYIFVRDLNYRDTHVWGDREGADHRAMSGVFSYSK